MYFSFDLSFSLSIREVNEDFRILFGIRVMERCNIKMK